MQTPGALADTHTFVADAADLRERFGLLGSLITANFGSRWQAEPLSPEQRPARISWAGTEDRGVSRAEMNPLTLRCRGFGAAHATKYFLYTANQPSIVKVEHERIEVAPGDVLVLNNALASEWVMTRGYVCSSLVLHADLFRTYVPSPERLVARSHRLPFGLGEVFSRMMNSAWAMAAAGHFEAEGTRLVHSMLEMLSCAFVGKAGAEQPRATALRRMQAQRIMDTHFHDCSLNIERIAGMLGVSTRFLQAAFAEEQQTPLEYLRNVRLNAAARRLSPGSRDSGSITDIALDCGFGTSAHFATEFRRRFGMTPSEFRRTPRG